MSVFLRVSSVCQTQKKRNVLFHCTVKPMKHFETFRLFWVRQTDTMILTYNVLKIPPAVKVQNNIAPGYFVML